MMMMTESSFVGHYNNRKLDRVLGIELEKGAKIKKSEWW